MQRGKSRDIEWVELWRGPPGATSYITLFSWTSARTWCQFICGCFDHIQRKPDNFQPDHFQDGFPVFSRHFAARRSSGRCQHHPASTWPTEGPVGKKNEKSWKITINHGILGHPAGKATCQGPVLGASLVQLTRARHGPKKKATWDDCKNFVTPRCTDMGHSTARNWKSLWKPSILLGEFRYRFRSWSWSNNWPLYWNLEWILYRILAPICQQPCLFWTVQVSITDFASLAAVAEGKVWLAGPSAMGVTVAQRIIEYSNPFKSRKGKRERESKVCGFWTLSLNMQPIIQQMPKQWWAFVHVWFFVPYPLLVRHAQGTYNDLYNHKVHQIPED